MFHVLTNLPITVQKAAPLGAQTRTQGRGRICWQRETYLCEKIRLNRTVWTSQQKEPHFKCYNVRNMLSQHGHSVVFLPASRITTPCKVSSSHNVTLKSDDVLKLMQDKFSSVNSRGMGCGTPPCGTLGNGRQPETCEVTQRHAYAGTEGVRW